MQSPPPTIPETTSVLHQLPDIWLFVFAFFGALGLWLRLKYNGSKMMGIDGLVEDLFEGKVIGKLILEAILFCGFGSAFATLLCEPATIKQAIAAGLAWTGLISTPSARAKTGTKNAKQN